MRPLVEQLNEELERVRATGWQNASTSVSDPTVDGLVSVARRLRATAELRVDPTFARHLEQQLHAHHAALRRAKQHATWWSWRLPGGWRAHPWLSAVAALCLVLLLSFGVLLTSA